ncbi:MAG: carboxypeptidase-like regulatory domain-containing protein [Bacteroidetes bacterium]|nr:carboxypeptidase-like regulatory domain-containing protein [Bacteroidota bacterium]
MLKPLTSLLLFYLLPLLVFAQYPLRAVVMEGGDDSEVLSGVSVQVVGTNLSTFSDSLGQVELENVPSGEQSVIFSYLGFEREKCNGSFLFLMIRAL